MSAMSSPRAATIAVGVATAAVTAYYVLSRLKAQQPSEASARIIVAVSGTIQDGFELRKNIDFTSADGKVVRALLLGYAVVRGVKMYFDVKDIGCREYDPSIPHRVNPAMVLTGDKADANQYALYLVDERACLNALLGEPRLLTMTPDAVRLELNDAATSPEVAALARAIIAKQGKTRSDTCAVLAVVPCYKSKCFVPAPPMEKRDDGTRLTSFRASLAKFAGLGGDALQPGSAEWNGAVAKALSAARQAIARGEAVGGKEEKTVAPDDSLYGTAPDMARLSTRMSVAEFNGYAEAAGIALRAEESRL